MDSQIASPDAPVPDSLNPGALLDNAIIGRAQGNEFTNAARDNIRYTFNYNVINESENVPDVINHLQKIVPLYLAEVHKNDHSSQSTLEETIGTGDSDPVIQAVAADTTPEGDPVDIMDIVPLEPSSLPVVSMADLYTRSMLKCLAGYPLYEPQPFSELSTEYLRNGVNVGDVGFVREDGTFDFLFNICQSKNASINPSALPIGFSLKTSESSATRALRPLPRETCFFKSPVTKTNSGEYICEGSEGAILELPEGAIQNEATNVRPFEKLAARHGVQWYEYTMTRGRKISNGSLYLITAFTKCTQWGIAVFDRPCAPGQGLRFGKKRSFPFGKSKYHWNGFRVFPTKASDPSQRDVQNQCVFLRGYKIMIRQDIFDNLDPCRSEPTTPPLLPQAGSSNLTRQRATRIRGGGGPNFTSKPAAGGSTWSPMSAMASSDEVFLHANFSSSLIHPSDLINIALLSQNPNAKVALTHDDVWCNILRDNFPKLNYARLMNVARSYMNTIDGYDCVSLQNRPLQRTETAVLQGLPTTLDEDYTYISCMNSLNVPSLPRELVERILFLLDTKYIRTCKLVNRGFNEIIESSKVLQYFLACNAAGVIDNPRSTLTYGERLEALEKREDAWRKLKPVFEMTIQVNHQPSPAMIYGLAGGAYFLDNKNLTDLNYCPLPSFPQDNPRWLRIPAHGPGGGSSGIFNSFGMAIYEHDLIINVISSDTGNQADIQRHSLDMVLLKFSTGEYHPLAHHPRIHIQRLPEARPAVTPEIVGDNLALVVYSRAGTFPDKLFIFDWKTGHKRLQHEATVKAYSGLVFLSPELLLVPNLILSHFEVWHLPPSDPDLKPPTQVLSLKIPAISRKYSLFDVSCNGEPNPFLHSIPYFPPRPFFTSRENSIIIINLVLSPNRDSSRRRHSSYTLIMHRRALLDTIQKWTSSSFIEQQEDLPASSMNQVRVHKILDSEGGLVMLAQSTLVSTTRVSPLTRSSSTHASSSRIFPASHISTSSGSSSFSSVPSVVSSTSQYSFLPIQWADWGPSISRWLQVSEIQGQLIATSAGQRYAFAVPSPRDSRKLMVSVADFNPYYFKENAERMARFREQEYDGNGDIDSNDEEEEEEQAEFEILDHKGVFSEDVYMGLKCVIYHSSDEYDFDQLLMDEERLLGLKVDDKGMDESIKVLYFG